MYVNRAAQRANAQAWESSASPLGQAYALAILGCTRVRASASGRGREDAVAEATQGLDLCGCKLDRNAKDDAADGSA